MSRRAYIISFMVVAMTFVPVLFTVILDWMVAPCSLGVLYTIWSLWQGWQSIGAASLYIVGIDLAYVAFYGGIFCLVAYWIHRLSQTTGKPIYLQIAALLIVFSCSFLPVIKAHNFLAGDTGTYSFWTGCVRVIQTWHSG